MSFLWHNFWQTVSLDFIRPFDSSNPCAQNLDSAHGKATINYIQKSPSGEYVGNVVGIMVLLTSLGLSELKLDMCY